MALTDVNLTGRLVAAHFFFNQFKLRIIIVIN